MDFCDNAKLENVFDQILAENKFSWIDVNNVGGMAYPDSFAYIKALESKGVKCLVSLTNEAVLPQEWFTQASAVPGWSSIRNEHISVRDFVVPTIAQIRKFVALANQPLIAHSAGGNEVIDIMLACWLVKEKKMTPAQAIEEMRLKRPGSVETKEQEKAIEAYKADLDKPSPWTYYLANAPAVVGPLAYTNQQALIQDISSYVFADTYVPGIDSEQRKKLQDVFDAVPVLLDSPDDVFALLKSHGKGRRIKLLLTHILLQSGYQDDEFLKNYAVQYTIVSNANIGPNYNYLAARNYNLLIKNIQNKIYTLLQAHMLNGARKGIGGNNQQYFTLGLTLGNNYPGVL